MDLDLGAETEINVKWRGETYLMREPTVAQVEKFKESQAILPFLVELGLPENVAASLPMSKVDLLVRSIIETISKKK